MTKQTSHSGHHVSAYHAPNEDVFGANAVRLSPKQCAVAAALLIALYILLPVIWKRIEPLKPGADYRIPYALSDDYWLYARYAEDVTKTSTIPLIGDSVIWGQYVESDQTLSHALNKKLGSPRFANLGLNGSHPVALAGLLKHFGSGIRNSKVVLHYNPLWTTSKRRDLQGDKASPFNHPQLVPQFYPRIPIYDASGAQRLSRAIDCRVPFLSWTEHLRKVYLQNESVTNWTLEHPYQNPIAAISLVLPEPEPGTPSPPIPWSEKDASLQSFDWVKPSESLQWEFLKKSLTTLRSRGNTVFVLVGPFNEHMLTDESRTAFSGIRTEIETWLDQNGVEHFAPPPLPSELYADASHPIAEGYTALAQFLVENESFRSFLSR